MSRIEYGWLVEDNWAGGLEDVETPGAPLDPGWIATHMLSGVRIQWVCHGWRNGIQDMAVFMEHPAWPMQAKQMTTPLDSVTSRRWLLELILSGRS